MQPNPNPDTLPEGSRARRLATEFAGSYTRLLNALETNAPPRNREVEAEKARARARVRFG